MRNLHLLQSGLSQLKLSLSQADQEKLITFLHFLKKWNKAYNLTAITDMEQMIAYHLLDSLSIAPYVTGEHVVDVGSGAGLPGIPLAIFYPQKKFVLIDSVGKKTRFINQAARHLDLNNVTGVHTRALEYPTPQAFDTMTARAVGSMAYLLPIAQHLLRPSGELLVMKSELSSEERSQLDSDARVISLKVPGISTERSLVYINFYTRIETWQKSSP